MIEQEIPKEQLKIIQTALNQLERNTANDSQMNEEEKNMLLFDILTLRKLLNYKITVTLSGSEMKKFTQDNGIDFPIYVF